MTQPPTRRLRNNSWGHKLGRAWDIMLTIWAVLFTVLLTLTTILAAYVVITKIS